MSARGLSVSFNEFWTRNERKVKGPKVCCYSWFDPCPGGRPLLDARDAARLLASVRSAPARSDHFDARRVAYWTAMARSEHASVASFARFALELLALGAPASLVERAHRAALDEIAHTALAVWLVQRFGGGRLEIGTLDVEASGSLGSVTPAEVVRGTARDGCVGETRAALDAEARLGASTDSEECEALGRIAVDESAHAQLAFDAVDWIVSTFGGHLMAVAADAVERVCGV